MDQDAEGPGGKNDDGFGDFPLHEQKEGDYSDRDSPEVTNGMFAQDYHSAGDGPGGRRRNTLDKGAKLPAVRKTPEIRSNQDYEQILTVVRCRNRSH